MSVLNLDDKLKVIDNDLVGFIVENGDLHSQNWHKELVKCESSLRKCIKKLGELK